jgi:hypothetical protein
MWGGPPRRGSLLEEPRVACRPWPGAARAVLRLPSGHKACRFPNEADMLRQGVLLAMKALLLPADRRGAAPEERGPAACSRRIQAAIAAVAAVRRGN